MSFFRAIWKGNPKHKKLSEEWALAKSHDSSLDSVSPVQGVTFKVKMLGSIEVALANSEKATAKAVQAVMSMVKAKKCKPKDVQMRICLDGISVTDLACDIPVLDVSIDRISYCSADAAHGNVFAFIASNGERLECYAFMCPRRKMAQLVSVTVAQTFNTAFHLDKLERRNQENNSNRQFNERTKGLQTINNSQLVANEMLIDFSSVTDTSNARINKPWTSFEDDNLGL